MALKDLFRGITGGPARVPVTVLGDQPVQGPTSTLPYANYGYIPGVAQAAQDTVPPDPHLSPRPYFTDTDLAHALWYTTRVHLSPTGKA